MKRFLSVCLSAVLLSCLCLYAAPSARAEGTTFTRYALTEEQLVGLARICQREQGTVAGAKAEASLMANQLETSKSRQNKYGTGPDGLYNWVRNGRWFGSNAGTYMDTGSASSAVIEGVRDVLVNGNRTLPWYVDEHDCLSDISSISTGDPNDRSAYIQGVTVVNNVYGSTWTFWCFPASNADPFGYTQAAYDAVGGRMYPDGPIFQEETGESLQFKDVTHPTTWVIKSAGWDVSGGTLVSDAGLTAIRSEIIRNSDGYVVTDSGFKSISGHSYPIKGLDDAANQYRGVRFSLIHSQGLGAGSYTWRLTGRDSLGRTIVLPMVFSAVYSGTDANGQSGFAGPAKASLSVQGSDDLHETALRWSATADTTHYGLTVCKSDGTEVYSSKNFSAASSPNALMMLEAGSYTAKVASAYTGNGSDTWVYSEPVSFTVSKGSEPSAGKLVQSGEYGHRLYQLYQKACTWREAEYLAEQYGGTLAGIPAQGVQEALAAMVRKGGFNAWIGAEAWPGPAWSWAGGEAWGYANWASGEPDGGNGKENCAGIFASSGKWYDTTAADSGVGGFVAEYAPADMVGMTKELTYPKGKEFTKDDLTVIVAFRNGVELETSDYVLCGCEEAGGLFDITLRYGDAEDPAALTVHVQAFIEQTVADLDIWFDDSSCVLEFASPSAAAQTLKPHVSPSSAAGKALVWSSSNKKVATVDADGRVTPKGVGFAVITCTFAEGSADSTAQACAIVHDTAPLKPRSGLETIGAGAFKGTAVREVYIPKGVKKIGAKAFASCGSLKIVHFPSSVKTIDASAFQGCGQLIAILEDYGAAYDFCMEHGFEIVINEGGKLHPRGSE